MFGRQHLSHSAGQSSRVPAVLGHVGIDAGRHGMVEQVQTGSTVTPFFAMIAAEASSSRLVWLSSARFFSEVLM